MNSTGADRDAFAAAPANRPADERFDGALDALIAAEEYKSLRDEARESRRYVFERPLVILAGMAAATQISNIRLAAVLILVAATLLRFNFTFTVNRVRSAARIVAYLQTSTEERRGPGIGWESALCAYRFWYMENKQKCEHLEDKLKASDEIPDSTMFYPAVYYLHIAFMIYAFGGSIYFARKDDFSPFLCAIGVLVACVAASLIKPAMHWTPRRGNILIQFYRIKWAQILDELSEPNSALRKRMMIGRKPLDPTPSSASSLSQMSP